MIYVINFGPTDVDVTIKQPAKLLGLNVRWTIPPDTGYIRYGLQSSYSKPGTGVDNKGIRVTSSAPVLVQVSSDGRLSADGFFVPPTSALGTDHYVASYYHSATTYQGPYEIWVVAIQDSTEVTVYLNCDDPQEVVVTVSGTNKYCGDTISATVDYYKNFQVCV